MAHNLSVRNEKFYSNSVKKTTTHARYVLCESKMRRLSKEPTIIQKFSCVGTCHTEGVYCNIPTPPGLNFTSDAPIPSQSQRSQNQSRMWTKVE
jgi:hypothetical protein